MFLKLAKESYKQAKEFVPETESDNSTDITLEWLLAFLEEYSPVTKYVFNHEVERKMARCAESIISSPVSKDKEVMTALRLWAQMVAEYALEVTDEATKQAYKDSGVKKVIWLSFEDSRRCKTCKDRHNKVYDIDKIPPKPHIGCRCYVMPYDEKINEISNERNFLRNNLPKKYKDIRNVGKDISNEELKEIFEFAERHDVQIGHAANPTGGFETYCGNIDILKNIITEVEIQQNSLLFANLNTKNVILVYDNVLGYEGDPSKIDVGAFAVRNGRIITLNKFMFDDSDFLIKEYNSAVEEGVFVKDTTYVNIIAHEFGHIIDGKSKSLYSKTVDILEQLAFYNGMTTEEFIYQNISKYARSKNDKEIYGELIAEINSLLYSKPDSDIIKLLKEKGVIP